MLQQLHPVADSYVQSINGRDPAAFIGLFAEDAAVDDNGRPFSGREAIRHWGEQEIFAANVTLEVIDSTTGDGVVVIKTRVDGTFDKTGLPDPLIIDQTIRLSGDRIASLTCRLAA